jgi:hypothetical protein
MSIDKKKLVQELRDYADSLDEHVTVDDIYQSLTDLASEIETGIWDY